MSLVSSGKRQTPGQMEHRRQWILDTVSANQGKTALLLLYVGNGCYASARALLGGMRATDRDALLQENGILSIQQIEELK